MTGATTPDFNPRTAVGDDLSTFLGMRWLDEDRLALEIRPHLVNRGGRLLGPVGYALVDYSMGAAIWPAIADDEAITTVNIAMNYMDSAGTGEIHCVSRLDRRARRMAWVTSEVRHEDGRLLYTAIGTFAIIRRPEQAVG